MGSLFKGVLHHGRSTRQVASSVEYSLFSATQEVLEDSQLISHGATGTESSREQRESLDEAIGPQSAPLRGGQRVG